MRVGALALGLALTAGAAAQEESARRALAPRTESPVTSVEGGEISAIVEVATALALPPGVQSERALRGFAARACPSVDAAARCTPLFVRNVRPVDARSLLYRMQIVLPASLAPGVHDLEVRFPGGEASVARGLLVTRAAPRPLARSVASAQAESCALAGDREPGALVGLLVGVLSWKLAAGRRNSGQ